MLIFHKRIRKAKNAFLVQKQLRERKKLMAAHVVTGIKETIKSLEKLDGEDQTELKRILKGIVDNDCWTGEDFPVWGYIDDYVEGRITNYELKTQLQLRLPALEKEKEMLEECLGEEITCREDWLEAIMAKYRQENKEF